MKMQILTIIPLFLFLEITSARTIYHYPRNSIITITRRDSNNVNLQPFTSALGGIAAPPVTNSDDPQRPFEVTGNTFVNLAAALQRSCDVQFNACADAANSQGGNTNTNTNNGGLLTVGGCQAQKDACEESASSASTSSSSSSQSSSSAAVAVASQAAGSSSSCGN